MKKKDLIECLKNIDNETEIGYKTIDSDGNIEVFPITELTEVGNYIDNFDGCDYYVY